ncbi:MAG: hypothetical protein LBE91_00970 [Tannerella sp.]|jgi:hypothetical protein|nr:hypothetical protein [Tannerella sp.]
MKRKVFLLFILAVAGMVSVNAQMRIGGSETPNSSAVLDLNPDDDVSAGNASLGLALPRVNLRNSGDAFPLLAHVRGMTVYNMATDSDVKPGVYVSDGVKWLRQADGETSLPGGSVLEKDSIVGNEVADATSGGGLFRSGAGTELSPYTLGIEREGVTTDKIADQSVTLGKLADNVISTLGSSMVYNTTLGDILIGQITQNFGTSGMGDSIVKLVHENELDGVVGNEVVDATVNGGLIRSGTGTELSPFTLGIAPGGVTAAHLADSAVTSGKIAANAVTTVHIEDKSVTREKLSDDIVNEIMWNSHAGITPPEHPNSILIGNQNLQWKQQQIPGTPIQLDYTPSPVGIPGGWVDMGYAQKTVPAGLYVATVQIANIPGALNALDVDYVMLDTGGAFTWTIARKPLRDAAGNYFNEPSCITVFVSDPATSIRLYVHSSVQTYSGNVTVTLQPILQLY